MAFSPCWLSDAPRWPKRSPRPPQDGPRGTQEAPRRRKRSPRRPRRAPERPQEGFCLIGPLRSRWAVCRGRAKPTSGVGSGPRTHREGGKTERAGGRSSQSGGQEEGEEGESEGRERARREQTAQLCFMTAPEAPQDAPRMPQENSREAFQRQTSRCRKAPWSTPKLRCYVLICDTRTLAFSPVTAPRTTQEPSKIAPRRAKRAPKGFSNGATTVRQEPNAAQEGRTTPQESPHRGSRQPKSAPRKPIISQIRTSM